MTDNLKTYLVRVPQGDLTLYYDKLGAASAAVKPRDLLDEHYSEQKIPVVAIIGLFAEAGAVIVDNGYASQTLVVTLPEPARAQMAALKGVQLREIAPPPKP